MNIGNIYADQGESDIALEYYFKSLNTNREYLSIESIEFTHGNIANLYNEIGNYKKAIIYADSALMLSKKIDDIEGERLAYNDLSVAYGKLKNYKLAYEYHLKYTKLTDSIFNEENSKQLGDLKTQFEVDKKEAELKVKSEVEKEKLKAIAAEETKRQSLVIYSIIVVLLIVVVFSALLFKRFRLTNKQKHIIELKSKQTEEQKHIIEEKHKEITDSINYAERIQRSFIATKQLLDENLNDYFVVFKPKDVVSGDFYWAAKFNNNKFALVTADSTGHGVPGAIMSLLNVTSIETALKDGFCEPAQIFNSTRKTIIERLKKDGSAEGGKDGMDASLCVYDFNNKKLSIAAANNPVWIIRNSGSEAHEVIEVKPDKMPIGKHDKQDVSFTQQEFDLKTGDVIYTLTDGFPDQFGGTSGKKFMSKKLREMLTSIAHLPMLEQKQLLESTFADWVGNMEQVDDITLIGVRV
jgi:serine phosphatase RsbU (regulator of sigma subunit)